MNFVNIQQWGQKMNFTKSELSRAETLRARGLDDEKLISLIIDHERAHGAEPKRLRAEMYDKMNHTCRKYTDRMIRMRFDYDFTLDTEAFKKVMVCFLEKTPVFHSAFKSNFFNPYWRVMDYKIDDVTETVEQPDVEADILKFFEGSIPLESNLQLFCKIFLHSGKTTICFLLNHMCSDGGDLKRFLVYLCKNYSEYIESGNSRMEFPCGPRGYRAVYANFSFKDKIKSALLLTNPLSKEKHKLCLTPDSQTDKAVIVRRSIDKELFSAAKTSAKCLGASVNDMLSAAYLRAVYELAEIGSKDPLEISCAVNLRRHMKHPENTGMTNHTAFMVCAVPEMGESIADTLKFVAASTRKSKEDRFLGLHGLPLLDIGYKTMVYAQAQLVIRAVHSDANFVLSNVGEFKSGELALNGHEPVDCFMCGGAKQKPSVLPVVCTSGGNMSMAVCIRGNDEDKKILERLFDLIVKNIKMISEL